MYSQKKYFLIVLFLIGLTSCSEKKEPMFKLLDVSKTKIDFENTITETDDFNILTNEYIFNGGGIAISDFNKDGLPDIFFTGNMVSNRLYLNQGKLKFKDVTAQANLKTNDFWTTGVAVADINEDGLMDIYVCGAMNEINRTNKLFVSQGLDETGVPIFEEQAIKYGVDDDRNSMGAAFLDYDHDGDLDLYVLNNEQNETIPTNYRKKIIDGTASSNDRLYQNQGNGQFIDVTIQAGIKIEGYGLSVTPLDVNKDSYTDLYITNDYLTNDLLYINQKDGTFKNQIDEKILHQSKFSMGSDAADFDNDGYTDIVTLDMLGESHQRRKTTIAKSSFFQNILNKKWGYQDQHMRNMLFKNNGTELPFSEIGQFAGIYQTDWSWAPLFFDVDYDGDRDLLITNGFPRDITDMDFANYKLDAGPFTPIPKLLDAIPIVKIPNYAFKNNGNQSFEDNTSDWGLKIPSFSNGAVLSDLDLDGDLDYVVNNINDKAFVFENTLLANEQKPNYLQIELKGSKQNPNALGAKVVLRMEEGQIQFQEQQLSRGYMSSVDPILYFGLGTKSQASVIEIMWPDGNYSEIKNPELNKRHVFHQKDAKNPEKLAFPLVNKIVKKTYEQVASKYGIDYLHQEKNVQDFFNQRLIPHKLSQNGPCLAVGDLNGDDKEDFIIGSSSDFSPVIYFQTTQNSFKAQDLFTSASDKAYEIESIALFDADQDGDLDLYLVSGGNMEDSGRAKHEDRLLLNNGKGNFKISKGNLPVIYSNGAVVRPFDYDLDGDMDLFIGGKNKPNAFPLADESFLLENTSGKFKSVGPKVFPLIESLGMVNDAQWGDINQDGRADLVIVGEYTGVQVFLNLPEGFIAQKSVLSETTGLWRTVQLVDLDDDGDQDILLGNLGKNNMLSISENTPLLISTQDIDGNGKVDPLMFCSQKDNNGNWDMYPTQFWDNLTQQSPVFRQEFNSYSAFSNANLSYYKEQNIIDEDSLLSAKFDASMWAENMGEGKFRFSNLPEEMQWGPINDFLSAEIEGEKVVFVVGNDLGGPPFEGDSDAFQGGIMNLDQSIKFNNAQETGFYAFGDARDLELITLQNGKKLILVSQNQGSLLVFEKLLRNK